MVWAPAPALHRGKVQGMRLEEMKRQGEQRLRELGLSLYEAWKCVEHGECPEGVDPVDVEEAFWMVVDALEALEKKNLVKELEQRYTKELGKKQRLTVPA